MKQSSQKMAAVVDVVDEIINHAKFANRKETNGEEHSENNRKTNERKGHACLKDES